MNSSTSADLPMRLRPLTMRHRPGRAEPAAARTSSSIPSSRPSSCRRPTNPTIAALDTSMKDTSASDTIACASNPSACPFSRWPCWRTRRARAANDRLHAAWRLTLYGLRRGEVLGLRWSDVDLKARTLTVSQSRVLVDYKIYVEPPKTRNGQRTLLLDDALVAALLALRKHLAKESEDAGPGYEAALPDLDWYMAGDRYIVVDQLGTPVHPEWYSDEFA